MKKTAIFLIGIAAACYANADVTMGVRLGVTHQQVSGGGVDLDDSTESFGLDTTFLMPLMQDQPWHVGGAVAVDFAKAELGSEISPTDLRTAIASLTPMVAYEFSNVNRAQDDIYVYAKAGIAFWNSELSVPGMNDESDNGNDFIWGVGARWQGSNNLYSGLELVSFNARNDAGSQFDSLSLLIRAGYRF
uniref:outer membrane beta-barrel protein n=1 Tax=Thaumasiovibrio occultus TaxID=1891184 RepID=UPI000B363467|nr:outer membrane beta-barrel protein [Thaumasiovibrio occultus]